MGEHLQHSGSTRNVETRASDGMPREDSNDGNFVDGSARESVGATQLVIDHHESLYRYAFRLAGNQPDAEDLVQQTFLLAQERIHQLRDPSRARSWLFAVLRSVFLKSCRRTTPTNASSMDVAPELWPEKSPDDSDLDLEQLQQALGEIPEESRVILLMFYFEQASYKQIAEQLELKLGTVMSRLARAKEKLRERLAPSRMGQGQRGDDPARQSPLGKSHQGK